MKPDSELITKTPSSSTPPNLAMKILSLCVPAKFREHITGDLVEEYLIDRVPIYGPLRAKLWFWKQTLLCSYEFLNKQQGGIMAFIFSTLFFVAMMAMIIWLSASPYAFVNIPSLLVILPTALFLGVGMTSVKSMKLSLKLLISEQVDVPIVDIVKARKFLQVTGMSSMYLGYAGTIVGAVAIAASINAESFSKIIGPATAVCLLTLLYGLVIKILCYVAEQKIETQYLLD